MLIINLINLDHLSLKKGLLTCALIGLGGHAPNQLHGVVTILDLKVLFELKIMPLPLHGFFASFAENPLPFFLGHKLWTFVDDG